MRVRAASAVVLLAMWTASLMAQAKPYTPKNGIVNWKAVVFGGAFRVTTPIPLHGDFARFDRVEVVQAESLIGTDAPPTLLHRLTSAIVSEFRKVGRFSDVSVVRSYEPPRLPPVPELETPDDYRTADSLDAPMRPAGDMAVMDRERDEAARTAVDTLVVTDQVIDFARGNKFLQLLFLNLGNGLVTLRLSYFDKATGEELGRSIVSSDNSSKVVPSLLSTRTPLSGVAEGLVDQVTRRKVAAER